MPHPPVMPALAVVALLGVTAGIQLGRAAVEEIPARYSAPPEGTRSFAALSPNRSPEITEPTSAASSTYDGYGVYPEEYRPVHDPAVDGYDDEYSAGAPVPAEAPEFQYAVEEEAPRGVAEPDMDAIQRYAHFPVSADEARSVAITTPDAPD